MKRRVAAVAGIYLVAVLVVLATTLSGAEKPKCRWECDQNGEKCVWVCPPPE